MVLGPAALFDSDAIRLAANASSVVVAQSSFSGNPWRVRLGDA